MEILKKTLNNLKMPIIGQIKDERNIKLLQQSLLEEKKWNNPSIAYKWVAENYKKNGDKYGTYIDGNYIKQHLYEADRKVKFVDVDVFRQDSLYFKEHGKYCPYDQEFDAGAYKRYWDVVEYRRRNGMTAWAGIDENGESCLVHIPGNYYGFLNFAPINKVADDDDAIDNINQFQESDEDNEQLAMFKLEELISNLNIRDTRIAKKIVDFPDFFDGQYHTTISKNFARMIGLNWFIGKARRKGMSYFNSWDLFNDIDLNPYMTVILAAYDKKYLIHGKGLMKMLYTYSDFITKCTDFGKHRAIDNKEHLQFGYQHKDSPEWYGYLSEAIAVSAMNNPDVTIGKDVYQLAYEELGRFPNFKDSFEVTTSTAEAGDYKTGMICGWGTGGTDEANWKDFEDVYYNPNSYEALACNNVWDDGKEGTGCCYFYAHVDALEGCMDYNGNTDFQKAWEVFNRKKEKKRRETTDETAFEKWCGQRANSGLEAFAKSATNIFPREKIRLQLQEVERNPDFKYLAREGKLLKNSTGKIYLKTNKELEFEGSEFHRTLNDYPLSKRSDVNGCFVEWISPYRDPISGKIPEGLYVAFQDPYAHDKDLKNLSIRDSVGATYWFEQTNNITPYGGGIPVAAYIGRPPSLDNYNEQVMYGLEYYNAKLMFENDRGDTKRYMQAKRKLHYLFEEPEMQFARDLQGKTGRGYGMHMTDKRKAKGAVYLRDLLNTVIRKDTGGYDKLLLHYIYDAGLLKELLRWNMQGNFDRVSSWLIGSFIIKELEHREIEAPSVYNSNSFFNRQMF